MIPIFKKILHLPTATTSKNITQPGKVTDPNYQLKFSLLNCLLNIPPHLIRDVMDQSIADDLLEILKVQLVAER
jgi:hypothetical protein